MMGDGASSSRGNGSSSSSGRGDTVVVDHGRRRATCGYCRSSGCTSISHGLWAESITAHDYQELLDHGWRRSGCFLYKPEMESSCCPSYTIRLKATDFIPSKEQVRIHKKMQRFLDGAMDQSKDRVNSSKGLFNLADNVSLATATASSAICEKMCEEDEFIPYLSNKIDDAIKLCFGSGEFPFITQLPKANVKRVMAQTKKKLMERSEDLLYTSSISFQIAAAIRRSQSIDASQDVGLSDISPKIVAEKLACSMKQQGELFSLLTEACNGHLNFYSATRKMSSGSTSGAHKQAPKGDGNLKRSLTESNAVPLHKRRKLEIRMKRSSFDPEEFELYRRYQIKVHNDRPEKVTESSYTRFLVDTPITFVPYGGDKTVPPCGFGSFHQRYMIDGKLVAVGVVDILPRCLSSKYLFWDPDFAFLSLGKYSALHEINWVKETLVHCPALQYYYLGYYIHSCSKMRYKAAYRPSELLCPLRYEWVSFDIAKPLLDRKSYVVLSDFTAAQDRTSPLRLPGLDDESGTESTSASMTDGLGSADVSNIVIDLNGTRVKFKDLQRVFGAIEKRRIKKLEMQLQNYTKVVGQELADRMVYSLG